MKGVRVPLRRCGKKLRHPSRREAVSMMNLRMNGRKKQRHGRPEYLRCYECEKCAEWHLTHQREEGE